MSVEKCKFWTVKEFLSIAVDAFATLIWKHNGFKNNMKVLLRVQNFSNHCECKNQCFGNHLFFSWVALCMEHLAVHTKYVFHVFIIIFQNRLFIFLVDFFLFHLQTHKLKTLKSPSVSFENNSNTLQIPLSQNENDVFAFVMHIVFLWTGSWLRQSQSGSNFSIRSWPLHWKMNITNEFVFSNCQWISPQF